MVNYGKGYEATAGYAVASVWGTPVALGALDGIEYMNEDIDTDPDLIEDDGISGSPERREGDLGNKIFGGGMTAQARYQGLEVLFAQALGIAGVPTQVPTVNAYTHALKIHSNLEGIFGTLCIKKNGKIFEYQTAKVTGFSIKHTQGKRAEVTFRFSIFDLAINTSSGTNTTTTFATVTLPTNRDFLLFNQLVVRANSQAGGALGASDKLYISEFSMDFDGNFATDDVTTQFGNRIDEPIRDGYVNIKGSIQFSKLNDAATLDMVALNLTKGRAKMDVTWTGPAISTSTYLWALYFPNLQFRKGTPKVPGAGRIPLQLDFSAYRVTTAPTGFTAGYTGGVTMEIRSQLATDPLV